MFDTLTDDDRDQKIAGAILHREKEIDGYQHNIENYKKILASIPAEWPAHLLKYKGKDPKAIDIPLDDLEGVTDMLFRERVAYLIKTEITEQRKSKHVHAALQARITPDRFNKAKAKLPAA